MTTQRSEYQEPRPENLAQVTGDPAHRMQLVKGELLCDLGPEFIHWRVRLKAPHLGVPLNDDTSLSPDAHGNIRVTHSTPTLADVIVTTSEGEFGFDGFPVRLGAGTILTSTNHSPALSRAS